MYHFKVWTIYASACVIKVNASPAHSQIVVKRNCTSKSSRKEFLFEFQSSLEWTKQLGWHYECKGIKDALLYCGRVTGRYNVNSTSCVKNKHCNGLERVSGPWGRRELVGPRATSCTANRRLGLHCNSPLQMEPVNMFFHVALRVRRVS